jgi:alkylation response protein AidB-like acyl-CoA dehydrogenase
MQLKLSKDDIGFRDEVRQFIADELPHDTQRRIENGLELSKEALVDWHRRLYKRGWSCPHWPVELGGCDWSPVQDYLFNTELGAASAPGPLPFGPGMVAPVIFTFGTEEQQQRFLPGILSGDDWWCQGYSEPNSGSDLASLQTRANRDGDHYIVNGQKTWTTLAQWADWIFCLVRTDSSGKKQQGISFLLFDMTSPGITVKPIITMEGGHEVNEVFFDNVRVPVENRIGEENKGWTYAKFLLGYERSGMAGVPKAKRQLRRIRSIANQEQHHGQPLAEDVRFRQKLADIEVQIMTLEATELRSLAATAAGGHPGPESSFIKIRGTEIDQLLTELTVEAVGNYMLPFAPEVVQHGWNEEPIGPDYAAVAAPDYFNTRKVTIYGGSNEIQKNIIAKAVLGL